MAVREVGVRYQYAALFVAAPLRYYCGRHAVAVGAAALGPAARLLDVGPRHVWYVCAAPLRRGECHDEPLVLIRSQKPACGVRFVGYVEHREAPQLRARWSSFRRHGREQSRSWATASLASSFVVRCGSAFNDRSSSASTRPRHVVGGAAAWSSANSASGAQAPAAATSNAEQRRGDIAT